MPAEPQPGDPAPLTRRGTVPRTGQRNWRTVDIDLVSTEDVLRLLAEPPVAGAVRLAAAALGR